jgi:hypothetical protein
VSFWNRKPKHQHDFGPWTVYEEGEIHKITIFDEGYHKIGNYLVQKRICKDDDCGFVQLYKQELRSH